MAQAEGIWIDYEFDDCVIELSEIEIQRMSEKWANYIAKLLVFDFQ
ncbi:MAG: hypothetical protein JW702_05275 [Clostridiales bacterium]|nr:hypothetical protein [Clostridiales bacterium]